MKSGGVLIGLGIIILLIFLAIFLRRGSVNVPGINTPTVTPTPSLLITPSPSPTSSSSTSQNVSTIIENKSNLKLFNAALKAAGLDNTLKSGGPYTIFAPSDTTVISNLNNLPRDNTSLKSIIQYHIVNGNYSSSDLIGKSSLKTLRGDNLIIDISKGNGVTINGIKISEPDIKASNGTIHVIDGILTQ